MTNVHAVRTELAMINAEQSGDFIFCVFEQQWNSDSGQVTEEYMKKIGSKNDCGLYLFSVQSKVTGKRYPVYIGYTGRTFAKRFYEHATQENGVIQKVLVNKVFGDSYDLYVHTHSLSPVSAKVVESIFLQAFDFALNSSENGDTHDLDIKFQSEDSKQYFAIAYQNIMGELTKDVPSSFHGMGLEPSK